MYYLGLKKASPCCPLPMVCVSTRPFCNLKISVFEDAIVVNLNKEGYWGVFCENTIVVNLRVDAISCFKEFMLSKCPERALAYFFTIASIKYEPL